MTARTVNAITQSDQPFLDNVCRNIGLATIFDNSGLEPVSKQLSLWWMNLSAAYRNQCWNRFGFTESTTQSVPMTIIYLWWAILRHLGDRFGHGQPLHTFLLLMRGQITIYFFPFDSIIHIITSLLFSPSLPHEASSPYHIPILLVYYGPFC